MLALALALALSQSPRLAGPPVAAISGRGVLDYTTSLFLTGPALASQCTNGAYTTDQGGAISVTRASTAWCQNESATLSLIDANKPVVEADGLRVEAASSNRVASSEDISAYSLAGVVANGTTTDPFGNTVNKYDTTLAGGLLETPAAFTITGTSAVLSFWVITDDVVTPQAELWDNTASASRAICNGVATTSWTTMAARYSCSSSSIVSGNSHLVRLYPGGTGGEAVGVAFSGIQVEPGITVKTSYIRTTGTAASRAADNISTTTADTNTAGCSSATVTFATYTGGVMRIFNTNGGSPLSVSSATQLSMHDNANSAAVNVTNISGRAVAARSGWGAGGLSITSGGSTGTGTFDNTMGTAGALSIGSTGAANFINAWMKGIKIGTDQNGCAL